MDWRIGDLAVCVDARASPGLVQGDVYTVAAVDEAPALSLIGYSLVGLLLNEARPLPGHDSFAAERFRKIRPDEREACEPEFVTLLKRSKKRVGA